MKKIMLLLMVCMLVVTTACSSGSGTDENTITVWAMGEEAKVLSEFAKDFEVETGIKVKVQPIPWDVAREKLLSAVASKQGPDVIQMGTTWMSEFQDAGLLADITEYTALYPNLKSENFFDGSNATVMFNEKMYGVPWATDTRVLYYRTDALEKVGFDHAPKTWEELEAVAAALANRGDDKYGMALDFKEQSLPFMFARQNGSKLFDSNNQPLFNSPEFVDTISFMNNFVQKGYSPKTDLGLDISQSFGGEDPIVPMFISGPWMMNAIKTNAPDIDGKWSTSVLPKNKNNMSVLGGSNLSLFEYSNNKDNAVQFLDYMARPETQLEWFELTSALPTNKEAWNNDVFKNDKLISAFGEQLKTAMPMPMMVEFETIAQELLQSLETIYVGGKDVKAVMEEFNTKAKKILDK